MENKIATLSIYYDRGKWSELIRNAVVPIIQLFDLNNEDSDVNMLLSFYGDGQCNCELIFYGICDHFRETVASIENSIRSFVGQHPSSDKAYAALLGKVLWLPVPNNTVKLIFSSPDLLFENPLLLFYKQSLTNILIEEIIDDENDSYDDEAVFSHALWMQILLLKIIKTNELPVQFDKVFFLMEKKLDINHSRDLYQEITIKSAEDYYHNKEFLKALYDVDLGDDSTSMLNTHVGLIISMLKRDSERIAFNNYWVARLAEICYQQLGIYDSKRFFIHNMIKLFCNHHIDKVSEASC